MKERVIKVTLGEGEDILKIEVSGCPCQILKASDAIAELFRDMKSDKPKEKRKPCGCKDGKR